MTERLRKAHNLNDQNDMIKCVDIIEKIPITFEVLETTAIEIMVRRLIGISGGVGVRCSKLANDWGKILQKQLMKTKQVTKACEVCGKVINTKSMKRHVRDIHEKRKANELIEIQPKKARK